ncbi:hypothetical protein BGW41_003106 [Actinomortierella wolfii]|nr:hypothetical protein BGW41_003106 [Actinomortierella wolfii]
MSARSCFTCKKTVYVTEKVEADGRWYHKPCFKCSAPGCTTSLTIRTFQMAVLDENVKDESTGRPLKVLVCKNHVPLPKSSLGTDSLELQHTTSAPKPSMLGLHRALMGSKSESGDGSQLTPNSAGSYMSPLSASTPRSAGGKDSDRAGYESLSRQFGAFGIGDSTSEESNDKSSAKKGTGDVEEGQTEGKNEDSKLTAPTSMQPNSKDNKTLMSEKKTKATLSEEDQEEEDNSFRTLPVTHDDYEEKSLMNNPRHPTQSHREDSPEHGEAKKQGKSRRKSVTVEDAPEDGENEVEEEEAKDDESPARVNLTLNKKLLGSQSPPEAHKQSGNEDVNAEEDDDWGAPENKTSSSFYQPSIAV